MVIGHRSTMKCPLEKCPEKVAQNIHRRRVTKRCCITEPGVIHKILAYLDKQTLPGAKNDPLIPPLRAPPDDATCSDYIIQRDFDFGA